MRLARIVVGGQTVAARVDDGLLYPLEGMTFEQALLAGTGTSSGAGGPYRVDDVRLLPPITEQTRRIFGTGLNYRDHYLEGVGKRGDNEFEQPNLPTFFLRLDTSVIGPFDAISMRDDLSREFDYEAELAVVIGRQGRDVPVEDALSYVLGYTAANDVSARDVQRQYGQWMKGKSLDGTCPLGPWLVTADEIPDPADLLIECLVNGDVRQRERTAGMIHSVAELIHHLSLGVTLLPGDVLLTGTPEGTGWVKEPPAFLSDGDEVVTRVSRIGELRNRVRAERAAVRGGDAAYDASARTSSLQKSGPS